jgi:hypothetical protein
MILQNITIAPNAAVQLQRTVNRHTVVTAMLHIIETQNRAHRYYP